MSFLEYRARFIPRGASKLLHVNWALVVLLTTVASVGFLMLTSAAGGDVSRWAEPHMVRFAAGLVLMLLIGLVPIWFWRSVSGLAYAFALVLLVMVEFFGTVGMGAQRWIDLGFIQFQPSEMMKIALVMCLAAYYDWLPLSSVSRPQWVLVPLILILIPAAIIFRQPDLGTTVLLVVGSGIVMFCAGVSWWYFLGVVGAMAGMVFTVFLSRGTDWQILQDYQYRRINIFLDPSIDPLGAGYHITQSKIALGSGGWAGKGFMQGTQSRLNFLPEKHTDFIFTTLAEEFGFVGGFSLLSLYGLIIFVCVLSALGNKNRFGALLTLGVSAALFLHVLVNISMVVGLAPVVGVPLPLVSYGGSALLVLMMAFGLVQSAHVYRWRN